MAITTTPEPSVAELEDRVCELQAAENVVRAGLLVAIQEFMATEAWVVDGARSPAEWLAMRLGVSWHHARDLARVAEALTGLPALAEAFREGRLSWDKLRTVTRYATPETDAALAAEAAHVSLSRLERQAREAERRTADDDAVAHRRRRLHMARFGDRLRLGGDVYGDASAVVEQALTRLASQAPKDEGTGEYPPFEARLADALVELCSTHIEGDADADRATVVVHVDLADLRGDLGAEGDGGVGEIETGGMLVSSESVRRLSCDCNLEEFFEYGGIPVGLGTKRRTPSARLRRELRRRDHGCRFPGCERRRWVHAHHILHWSRGGPTDLGNLVLLCSHHHRFVHEMGWMIRGNPYGDLEFVRPDGTILGREPARHRQLRAA